MTHTRPGGVTTSTPGADIIDTAIVIKNIPFSYPEETFREKLFEDLSLSPPEAFNYHRHRTDGVFRGLAFANFKDPNHALEAVSVLNKFKLEGRPLIVELKKRLSPEDEQRQRLEKQARRQIQGQQEHTSHISSQTSPGLTHGAGTGHKTSLAVHFAPTPSSEAGLGSPSVLDVNTLPQAFRPKVVFRKPVSPTFGAELDMNNEETLGFYTAIQVFLLHYRSIPTAALEFPPTLNSGQRCIVRSLAQKHNLEIDYSESISETCVTVFKSRKETDISHNLKLI